MAALARALLKRALKLWVNLANQKVAHGACPNFDIIDIIYRLNIQMVKNNK